MLYFPGRVFGKFLQLFSHRLPVGASPVNAVAGMALQILAVGLENIG